MVSKEEAREAIQTIREYAKETDDLNDGVGYVNLVLKYLSDIERIIPDPLITTPVDRYERAATEIVGELEYPTDKTMILTILTKHFPDLPTIQITGLCSYVNYKGTKREKQCDKPATQLVDMELYCEKHGDNLLGPGSVHCPNCQHGMNT